MENEPNSHQQNLPNQSNLKLQNTLTTESQTPQCVQNPFTPNQANQTHILEYKPKVQDKQTLEALKMFKAIFNDKEQWNLSSKKWIRLKLKKVFENLSLALPTKIDLTHNKQPLLLDSLACIATFPCLKELKLCNNKISTFEKLTLIDFPVLEELSLADNDIIQIKCLNKINFRPENIRKVTFYANRVISLEFITRVNFVNAEPKNNKTIKTLNTKENPFEKQPLQQEVEDYNQKKQSQQKQQKQYKKEHNGSEGQVNAALEPLSLMFGINQIGSMQEMNKLQRQVIGKNQTEPNEMRNQLQNDSLESFDSQNYKQNRRLIFSIQMNKYQSIKTKNCIRPQLQLFLQKLSPIRQYFCLILTLISTIVTLSYLDIPKSLFLLHLSQQLTHQLISLINNSFKYTTFESSFTFLTSVSPFSNFTII